MLNTIPGGSVPLPMYNSLNHQNIAVKIVFLKRPNLKEIRFCWVGPLHWTMEKKGKKKQSRKRNWLE